MHQPIVSIVLFIAITIFGVLNNTLALVLVLINIWVVAL